ncbi:hypothetical protein MMC27_007355 [Xylographa pallens]|nr:hypothetical protein [Xylographa pallens]
MAGVLLTPVLSSAQDYYGASDMATLWNIGFGTVTAYFLVRTNKAQNGSSELLLSILVANLPQLIFSFLYLLYNGIYTCMLLGYEWASYAKDRKALRVTSPSGKQASTYWLQLPYQYSVPLLVVSGLTHWIVSQSLFLARVGQYQTGEVIGGDLTILVSGVGYSPIAIIFVLIMGGLMVIGIFLNGFRRYHTGIPLAGSCSAAISAACHVPTNDRDAAVSLLQWGEVTSLTPGGVAHCTLTSQQVTLPVAGRLYK